MASIVKNRVLKIADSYRAFKWMEENIDRLRAERPSHRRLAEMLTDALNVPITEWNAQHIKRQSGIEWTARLVLKGPRNRLARLASDGGD